MAAAKRHVEFEHLLRKGARLAMNEGPQAATRVLREDLMEALGISRHVADGVAQDIMNGDDASFLKFSRGSGSSDETPASNTTPNTPQHPNAIRLLSKGAGELVIYGPASVAIVDRENDLITGPALEKALPQLLKRARFSLQHLDILVGEILPEWKSADGTIYKTEVRPVTEEDLDTFPKLKDANVQADDAALFCVGKIWDDASFQDEVKDEILKGDLGSFSISGQAVSESSKVKCDGFECKLVNTIDEIDLSAVTVCQEGMNQSASFVVLNKSMRGALLLDQFESTFQKAKAKAKAGDRHARALADSMMKYRRDWLLAKEDCDCGCGGTCEDGETEEAETHASQGPREDAGLRELKADDSMDDKKPLDDIEEKDDPAGIHHKDGKWVVEGHSGQTLGTHDSRSNALDQLRAIESNMHKQALTSKAARRLDSRLDRVLDEQHHLKLAEFNSRLDNVLKVWVPHPEGPSKNGSTRAYNTETGDVKYGENAERLLNPDGLGDVMGDFRIPTAREQAENHFQSDDPQGLGSFPQGPVRSPQVNEGYAAADRARERNARQYGREEVREALDSGKITPEEALEDYGDDPDVRQVIPNYGAADQLDQPGDVDTDTDTDELSEAEMRPRTPESDRARDASQHGMGAYDQWSYRSRKPPSLDSRLDRILKDTPPRDSVETGLPIGYPQDPDTNPVKVAYSDESAIKEPEGDAEYYSYPAGSDRTENSANYEAATGTRPEGYYHQDLDALDASLDKILKQGNPLDELNDILDQLSAADGKVVSVVAEVDLEDPDDLATSEVVPDEKDANLHMDSTPDDGMGDTRGGVVVSGTAKNVNMPCHRNHEVVFKIYDECPDCGASAKNVVTRPLAKSGDNVVSPAWQEMEPLVKDAWF